MIVFVNGEFVSEDKALVSVFDRGFLYGDSLFETILVVNGHVFWLDEHMERLRRGARFMRIPWSETAGAIRIPVSELLELNDIRDSVLRIQLTRGFGARGYSIQDTSAPTLVMSLHPAPNGLWDHSPRWKVTSSLFRVLANDPLTQIKSSNKLCHILARAEAESHGADEALLLNDAGNVAEATSGNVFWIERQSLFTTPLQSGALPGITRAIVMKTAAELEIPCAEKQVRLEELKDAESVFLTMSTLGIVEVAEIDDHLLPSSPLVDTLRSAYLEKLRA